MKTDKSIKEQQEKLLPTTHKGQYLAFGSAFAASAHSQTTQQEQIKTETKSSATLQKSARRKTKIREIATVFSRSKPLYVQINI